MLSIENTNYTPAIRLMKGEVEALDALDEPNKLRILPHLIIPPLSARDVEKKRTLSKKEFIDTQVGRISRHWGRRPCLLDTRLLKFESDDIADAAGLRDLLMNATSFGCSIIPVFDLNTGAPRLNVIKEQCMATRNGASLRISLGDLGNSKLKYDLVNRLANVDVKSHECVLIVDLSDADLSDLTGFSQFISEWIPRLQEIAIWHRIVIEATGYPGKNPASPNADIIVPRKEWSIWNQVIKIDSRAGQMAMFGDFGADNAMMNFKGGRKPITHLRYATPDNWIVARGGEPNRRDDGSIRAVARRIVSSELFCGELFSAGDEFIAACASGVGGPGNPTDWRRANMNHHMTLVTVRLGELYARPVERRQVRRRAIQEEMFPRTR